MPTLEQLISQKLNRLETIPNHLVSTTNKVQESILKQILIDLEGLETKGGKIILSNSNLIKIDVIGNKLQTVLYEGEYINAVKTFAGEFPKQATINKGIFDASFGTFSDKAIYNSVLKASQKSAINTLASTAIDNVFINPLQAQLTLAVNGEAGIATTANTLREFIIGGVKNGEIFDGTLERHVKQVSHDAYAVSDREYTQAISNDLGVEFHNYSGGTIKTTRCFCFDRNGKIFHNKEIEEWGKKPDLWRKTGDCSGGGRAEGTNEVTIFSLLGGYNCLHSLIPMPVEAVPEEVIQRAIAKGYYKAA